MKRIDFFSQEAYDFEILQNETMVIAVYQDIKFFLLDDCKVSFPKF